VKAACFPLLFILFALITLIPTKNANATDGVELRPVPERHIIELNSNQPYVAGYHVNSPNLLTRETVHAAAITVSFPSTDASYFPSGSWLGGGMFVQAQDNKLKHVDYAFYMMLVSDSSDDLFVDLGLHETRESTAPLQMPTEELVYAYTWQVSGINHETPVTLLASWDSEGFVHYSLSTAGTNINITSVNVADFPNCGSIIPQFYAGNYIAGTAFPFYHYVYYFQFGVVSSQIIADTHWSVDLKEPKILRNPEWHLGSGWHQVETAWSTQGDISYLDYDWKWGGKPYRGVSANYHQKPLENKYEVIFFYNGQTLPAGTMLWQQEASKTENSGKIQLLDQYSKTLMAGQAGILSIGIIITIGIAIGKITLRRLPMKTHYAKLPKKPRLAT